MKLWNQLGQDIFDQVEKKIICDAIFFDFTFWYLSIEQL